ncbi:MAG: hypothetical protein JXA37_04880 [Chloroflexia bacterium]|nr:hypothetical protein [Chloroflexia bacterium]
MLFRTLFFLVVLMAMCWGGWYLRKRMLLALAQKVDRVQQVSRFDAFWRLWMLYFLFCTLFFAALALAVQEIGGAEWILMLVGAVPLSFFLAVGEVLWPWAFYGHMEWLRLQEQCAQLSPDQAAAINRGIWMDRQGVRIWLADYRRLESEVLVEAIYATQQVFVSLGRPDRSNLILDDVREAILWPKALAVLIRTHLENKAYSKKIAVLGIGGLNKALLRLAGRMNGLNIQSFEDKEQAVNWLVK